MDSAKLIRHYRNSKLGISTLVSLPKKKRFFIFYNINEINNLFQIYYFLVLDMNLRSLLRVNNSCGLMTATACLMAVTLATCAYLVR